MENKKKMSLEEKIRRLLKSAPEWRPIIQTCVEVAQKTKNGEFAGAWVFWRLKERGIDVPSNLRKLKGLRVLVKTRSSRGGQRVYYRIPNQSIVEKALR